MPTAPAKSTRYPRRVYAAWLSGLLLLAAGGVLLAFFVKSPVGTLARWGFPQAWKGGPLLLGASFCTIIGFFLLIQRRFSLAAFLVSGIGAAALSTGALAYVRSIRETARIDCEIVIPAGDIPRFIELSRERVTPEYLSAIASDAFAKGWLRGIDFDSVTTTFGGDASDKNKVIVTLNFEFSPFVQTETTGARGIVRNYSDLAHEAFAERNFPQFPQNRLSSTSAEYLIGTLALNQRIMTPNTGSVINGPVPVPTASNRGSQSYYDSVHRAQVEMLQWLTKREPDPDVRKVFEKMLQDVEATLQN